MGKNYHNEEDCERFRDQGNMEELAKRKRVRGGHRGSANMLAKKIVDALKKNEVEKDALSCVKAKSR